MYGWINREQPSFLRPAPSHVFSGRFVQFIQCRYTSVRYRGVVLRVPRRSFCRNLITLLIPQEI